MHMGNMEWTCENNSEHVFDDIRCVVKYMIHQAIREHGHTSIVCVFGTFSFSNHSVFSWVICTAEVPCIISDDLENPFVTFFLNFLALHTGETGEGRMQSMMRLKARQIG